MAYIIETLHNAYNGKVTTLGDIQMLLGVDNDEASRLCFTSPHTYRRWRSDRVPNPCAVRLLGVLAGYVPWAGWEKWFYNRYDQKLYHIDLKYGFSPDELIRYAYLRQTKEALEREVLELRQRLKAYEVNPVRDRVINEDSNILVFPTLRALVNRRKSPVMEKQPASDRKTGLRDRFAGLFRRKAG